MMNNILEMPSKMDLGIGHITLKSIEEKPKIFNFGWHDGSMIIRSRFNSTGFQIGSEALLMLPEVTGFGKRQIIRFFCKSCSGRDEHIKFENLRFQVEHRREYARTFLRRRPLYQTTTLFKGVWRNPDLKTEGLTFSGIVDDARNTVQIEKDLSFLDKILHKIRGWKL